MGHMGMNGGGDIHDPWIDKHNGLCSNVIKDVPHPSSPRGSSRGFARRRSSGVQVDEWGQAHHCAVGVNNGCPSWRKNEGSSRQSEGGTYSRREISLVSSVAAHAAMQCLLGEG
uniref:Uncharacterized protein n=1 Tax=Zea mays TaxID=4577 RepID=A0A804PG58_MAIZE